MRQIKLALTGLIAVFLFVVMASVIVHADSPFQSGNTVTVPAGQTRDSALFVAGKSIDIAGTVNGDVFCAGQNVSISGTVNGDVFCAGQIVDISGTVNGSVRVAGQVVTVESTIAHNLSVAGQSVTVSDQSQVANDAELAGQSVTLSGTVGRDVFAGVAELTINSHVGRNVAARVQSLALGSQAMVGGNVSYTSTQTLGRASGAVVVGTVSRHQPPANERRQASGLNWGHMLYMLVSLLVLALVAVLLFPSAFREAAGVAERTPFKALGIGVVAAILVPVALLILCITVIGVPLAIMALLAWIVIWFVSWLFSAYYLGWMLLRKRTDSSIWHMLLGAAIIIIVGFIPILGFLVWLAAFCFGIGIIALHIPHLPRPKYIAA